MVWLPRWCVERAFLLVVSLCGLLIAATLDVLPVGMHLNPWLLFAVVVICAIYVVEAKRRLETVLRDGVVVVFHRMSETDVDVHFRGRGWRGVLQIPTPEWEGLPKRTILRSVAVVVGEKRESFDRAGITRLTLCSSLLVGHEESGTLEWLTRRAGWTATRVSRRRSSLTRWLVLGVFSLWNKTAKSAFRHGPYESGVVLTRPTPSVAGGTQAESAANT
jgi:hypothetical protein